jgi:hypothetical protein
MDWNKTVKVKVLFKYVGAIKKIYSECVSEYMQSHYSFVYVIQKMIQFIKKFKNQMENKVKLHFLYH